MQHTRDVTYVCISCHVPTRGNDSLSFWTKFQESVDIEHGLSIEDSFCLFIYNCVSCLRQGITFELFTASNRTRTTSDVIDDTFLHRRRERTDISVKFLTELQGCDNNREGAIGSAESGTRKRSKIRLPFRYVPFASGVTYSGKTPRTRRKDSKSDFITSRDKASFSGITKCRKEKRAVQYLLKKNTFRTVIRLICYNVFE